VAELADAPDSKSGGRKAAKVLSPIWRPPFAQRKFGLNIQA